LDYELTSWQIPFSASIPINGSFQDVIPGWESGKLISLVSARVLSAKSLSLPADVLSAYEASSYTKFSLKDGTLQDHTDQVSSNGHVSLAFAPSKHGIEHRIFAFYEHLTLHKALDVSYSTNGTIFDNGSYIVDHYSARGAETVIKFWEEHILIDGTKELLMQVGNYGKSNPNHPIEFIFGRSR
jgi:hypothetical protein